MVRISGRKDVIEAVLIAILTTVATTAIEMIAKEIEHRREKKRRAATKKKGKVK